MNRYGTAARGGPSKATASTLCQKCLKRDIYECKAVAQERPYVSRPSRTQQLLNPKLLPKLTSDVPQDLLRKSGIADEQLANVEKERGRKRDREGNETPLVTQLNRSRSASSSSSASVATISTNGSRSSRVLQLDASRPDTRQLRAKGHMTRHERKRGRSVSSEGSYPSDFESSPAEHNITNTRNIRRKIGESSPLTRGRRRSRSDSRGYSSYSSKSTSLERPQNEDDELNRKKGSQSKRTSGQRLDEYGESYNRSPRHRPRHRSVSIQDSKRRRVRDNSRPLSGKEDLTLIQSPSRDDGGHRNSQNTAIRGRLRDHSSNRNGHRRRHYSDVDERYGTGSRNNGHSAKTPPVGRWENRMPARERSMSPFSKRLALTQAMNLGR